MKEFAQYQREERREDKFMGQCYDCQHAQSKDRIGPNKKAYDGALTGITVVLGICSICGKKKGLVPSSDIDLAIRASNNQSVHPSEWD